MNIAKLYSIKALLKQKKQNKTHREYLYLEIKKKLGQKLNRTHKNKNRKYSYLKVKMLKKKKINKRIRKQKLNILYHKER